MATKKKTTTATSFVTKSGVEVPSVPAATPAPAAKKAAPAQTSQPSYTTYTPTGGGSPITAPTGMVGVNTNIPPVKDTTEKKNTEPYVTKTGVEVYGDSKWTPKQDTGVDATTRSAFADLTDRFRQYGLEELAGSITQMMKDGVPWGEAEFRLKTDPEYNYQKDATGKYDYTKPKGYAKRFWGNELRKKAGMNVYDERTYLATENQLGEVFKAYGQQGLLGDAESRQARFAKYMANDTSPDEVRERFQLAVDRVKNGPKDVLEALKSYYPNISDNDVVGYMLDPEAALPELKKKVTSSEIMGAFASQNLGNIGTATAEQLYRGGADRASAETGAQSIAQVLPRAQTLGGIYAGQTDQYNLATGIEEFMNKSASAEEKRRRMKSLERAQFRGESGTGDTSLSRTFSI